MVPPGRWIEKNIRERAFEVDHNFEGWRLDQFLANRIAGMSRSLAGRVAKDGGVTIDPPRKVKAGTKLQLGDRVVVREELAPEQVQDDEVDVLYSDDAVIILNKPAGMLVHETATVRLNTITHYLERQGLGDAEPVHRIDRETSGVLVCARRAQFRAQLCGLFATDAPSKIYRALVVDPDRQWEPGRQVTIDEGLGPVEDSELSLRMGPGALASVTHITAIRRVLIGGEELADLQVKIDTGRQHQIRAHLWMWGTPIAGDKLYGKSDEFFKAVCDAPDDPELQRRLIFSRHALHAWKISLPHPVTGEILQAQAPLPGIWDVAP